MQLILLLAAYMASIQSAPVPCEMGASIVKRSGKCHYKNGKLVKPYEAIQSAPSISDAAIPASTPVTVPAAPATPYTANSDSSAPAPAKEQSEPATQAPAAGSTYTATAGDIEYFDTGSSNHIVEPKSGTVNEKRFGFTLNKNKLDAIFAKIFPGGDPVAKTTEHLRKINGFNYNPSTIDPTTKIKHEAGTYLALSVAAKFKLVSPSSFASMEEAAAMYAKLKIAGMKGDAATVASLIKDPKGLSPEQLAYLWGTNEHQNLHAILFGNPDVYHAVHATSLNDMVGLEVGDTADSSTPNTLGGYNDKGTNQQWGWYEKAKGYNALVIPGL